MSRVIKDSNGVAVVEGTPPATLVKDADKFFEAKPRERMAGESVAPVPQRDRILIGTPKDKDGNEIVGRKPTAEEFEAYLAGQGITKTDEDVPKKPISLRDLLGPDFVCPDPSMNILMADGSQKKAGDLVVGDVVRTHHEESFELGDYKVEFTEIINDVEKIKLIFDKCEIVCSLSHKLYVDDSWKKVKDMVIGDKVLDKKLIAIEDVENGDVVRITIEDAHTYICEGLLSHNKSPRREPIGDIIGPEPTPPPKPTVGPEPEPPPRPETGPEPTPPPTDPDAVLARNLARDFKRQRSSLEAKRSEKERAATRGRFISTLRR